MTPRMEIVFSVLEGAIDNKDIWVIAACRRLIAANRLGWKRHANKSDIATVWAFADFQS